MSSAGQYLRLETTGRNSGTRHQVILRYISHNDKIILFPQRTGNQDWVKNIVANPGVRITYDGLLISGSAQIRKISGFNDPILSVFTRKYGLDVVRRYYWGQQSYVEICLDTALDRVSFSEMVYGDLEAAFDSVAQNYDHHILDNPINSWLRSLSIARLIKLFRKGDTVLEIGCGTGTETLSLAKHGIKVVAADISSKMLEMLQKKARTLGLEENILPLHCTPAEIKKMLDSRGMGELDGAYSTYGAVNTEPNLDQMMQSLHSVLRRDARLLLGVWNKYCVYEIAGYLLKGNPRLAFGRLRNPVPIGKSRFCVSSNAFSVRSLSHYLDNYFELQNVHGVVILLPPSNLIKFLPKGKVLNVAKRLDLVLGSVFPASRLGDHFLAEYRKK